VTFLSEKQPYLKKTGPCETKIKTSGTHSCHEIVKFSFLPLAVGKLRLSSSTTLTLPWFMPQARSMDSAAQLVVGLGELLWDFLPAGKKLGGAPANFAYVASLLGCQSVIASRVGADELGLDARSRVSELGLSTEDIQDDPLHPTGIVIVRVNEEGQPEFEIVRSVAWDFFEWTEQWRSLAQRARAVCFGSLAQRSAQSRNAIRNFLQAMNEEATRIFDVNLRGSFYSNEVISESLKMANVVKLNHEELPIVTNLLEIENDNEESAARKLRDRYGLDLVCVTRGANGSLLVSENGRDEHPGFRVQVADTIGAGDAFTAALVHGYLADASLKDINDLANRVGAWVSSHAGAMPVPVGKLENLLGEFKG
jgi:fructokinase